MKGGFFLMKKPLGRVHSVYTSSENAIAADFAVPALYPAGPMIAEHAGQNRVHAAGVISSTSMAGGGATSGRAPCA